MRDAKPNPVRGVVVAEQGGDHKVMNAALDQTSGERVAQIIWAQVFDLSPHARGGEPFLDSLYRFAIAIGKEPLPRRGIFDEELEDVTRHAVSRAAHVDYHPFLWPLELPRAE